MSLVENALFLELGRLRTVAEAQLVVQRETNRLLWAIATEQPPQAVNPYPVEELQKQAKVKRGMFRTKY